MSNALGGLFFEQVKLANRTGDDSRRDCSVARLGDRTLTSFDLDLATREIEVVVPANRIDQDGCFQLLFHIGEPQSPFALGVSKDDRELGIRLFSLKASDE
jgi:esterase/lipase superfamily enzyme